MSTHLENPEIPGFIAACRLGRPPAWPVRAGGFLDAPMRLICRPRVLIVMKLRAKAHFSFGVTGFPALKGRELITRVKNNFIHSALCCPRSPHSPKGEAQRFLASTPPRILTLRPLLLGLMIADQQFKILEYVQYSSSNLGHLISYLRLPLSGLCLRNLHTMSFAQS